MISGKSDVQPRLHARVAVDADPVARREELRRVRAADDGRDGALARDDRAVAQDAPEVRHDGAAARQVGVEGRRRRRRDRDLARPTKCDGVGFLHIFRRNSREKSLLSLDAGRRQ